SRSRRMGRARAVPIPNAIADDRDWLAAPHRLRQRRRAAASSFNVAVQRDCGATVHWRGTSAPGPTVPDREFVADTRGRRAWIARLALGQGPAVGLLHDKRYVIPHLLRSEPESANAGLCFRVDDHRRISVRTGAGPSSHATGPDHCLEG